MVTFHDFLANGQKILQEWNRRWGTGASFSHRAAKAFLGPVEVPADRVRGEILDSRRNGREVLLQLESIAFIDLRSIQADKYDEYRSLLLETIRVIEGVIERNTRADVARGR